MPKQFVNSNVSLSFQKLLERKRKSVNKNVADVGMSHPICQGSRDTESGSEADWSSQQIRHRLHKSAGSLR